LPAFGHLSYNVGSCMRILDAAWLMGENV